MGNALERLVAVFNGLEAGHKELSVLASAVDEPHGPNARLLRIAAEVVVAAGSLDFDFLDRRQSAEPRWYQTWPGEHYRLLAALARITNPSVVVEIGTSTGMGALTLAAHVRPGARVHTFDVVPWQRFEQTWLTDVDFGGGRITQHVEDLSRPEVFAKHTPLLASADLVFVDGPKDETTERSVVQQMRGLAFTGRPLVLFDDIRLLAMVELWRRIDRPKLDLTSFGHWSGSGLVDWTGRET